MRYTNLLEKLVSIFDITSDSWINLGFMAFFVLIIVLLCMKKISKRTGFIFSLVGDILLIGYTVVTHYDAVNSLVDNIIDHMFIDIYFPSIYVYLFVFFFVNIVTIGNLLNFRKKGIYRTINGIVFLVMNFILALVLDVVSKNKIDVFSKSSLFSNTDLIILLEFSVSVFIIWLLSLAIIYFTNVISEYVYVRGEKKVSRKKIKLIENVNLAVDLNDTDGNDMEENKTTVYVPKQSRAFQVIEEDIKENKFIPDFKDSSVMNRQLMIEKEFLQQEQKENSFVQEQQPFINNVSSKVEQDYVSNVSIIDDITSSANSNFGNQSFDLSSFIPPKKSENRVINQFDSNKILEQILNNQLPLTTSVEKSYDEERNTYTLNDYRIFNKMLKDIKEHNQSNTISIDKMLEYRLITKYSSETYDLFKRMLKNYSN